MAEKQFIAFYKNGTKYSITASSLEDAQLLAHGKTPEGSTLDFMTDVAQDFPCDYDWDDNIQQWQARLF